MSKAGRIKILLLDDSPSMRLIQRKMIEKIGDFEIEEAGDGIEALKMLPGFDFDLVLADWNMPRMNGIDFVKNAKRIKPNLPIIMVTTEAEKRRILEAVKAGVSQYVVKPFKSETLSGKIKKVLSDEKINNERSEGGTS